ncbi:family 16 glycosylhydrolase [Ferrimonas pelagia]|uniref:Beta-glucanase n=1 Tax=Ferrimonas pelagia TaxID=1177826 RepID=A0ABP9EZP3_9GAMM
MRHLAWSLLLISSALIAAPKHTPPPSSAASFSDPLTTLDSQRWSLADGWSNGSPFDVAWAADHVLFGDEGMTLILDDTESLGMAYTSGEIRSNDYYGYGCYQVEMQPVSQDGVITAFFTFTGPHDTPSGGNGRHSEIDIEFVGDQTSYFQANFWTNDDAYANSHEYLVALPFDAAEAFHDYGFKWTSTGISWYVDGAPVYQVFDSRRDPTPKVTDSTQKIMMNLWPVDNTAYSWAGQLIYPGEPLLAGFRNVRFEAGEACQITVNNGGGDGGDGSDGGDDSVALSVSVAELTLQMNRRGTQAQAQVRVHNDLGEAVSNAIVTGQWQGLVTDGDTQRSTDNSGTAQFYSRRSRESSGDFTFCVTSVQAPGLSYEAAANHQTCATVSK